MGDAVDVVGPVCDDNSSCRSPNSNPKIVMGSPWLVDDVRTS